MKNLVAVKLTGLGTGPLMLLGAGVSAALLYVAWRMDPSLTNAQVCQLPALTCTKVSLGDRICP